MPTISARSIRTRSKLARLLLCAGFGPPDKALLVFPPPSWKNALSPRGVVEDAPVEPFIRADDVAPPSPNAAVDPV
jgi:hypothetical protein